MNYPQVNRSGFPRQKMASYMTQSQDILPLSTKKRGVNEPAYLRKDKYLDIARIINKDNIRFCNLHDGSFCGWRSPGKLPKF